MVNGNQSSGSVKNSLPCFTQTVCVDWHENSLKPLTSFTVCKIECARILRGTCTCLCYFLRQMIVRFPSTCPQSASIQGFFYSYGRSSSESGSKSELRLSARRNSTPVQLLLLLTEFVEGGGLVSLVANPPLPSKKGYTVGPQIQYEAPLGSRALCLCRSLVTVSVYTPLHSQGLNVHP